MFDKILEKIKEFDTIIIHRHIRPDGDCIGSQMGLKEYLKHNFPNKHIYAVGDSIPEYLKYYGENDEIDDDIYKEALVIVVDTAVENRICDERFKTGKFIIKIDHHDDTVEFANLSYVDEKNPACSSILVEMMKYFEKYGYEITKEVARKLYIGITTDTGRFRYRGVNGKVLQNAGCLLDKGIDVEEIYTRLYIKKKETLKLQGYVYNHFKVTKNGVAYIYFTKEIINKFKVTKEDAANLVGSLDSIEGSLIWVAFVDQNIDPSTPDTGEIRVRIRSRFVAINDVACKYRGGGHLLAAGATIYSKDEMKNLLKELDQKLKQYKQENKEAF